MRRRKINDALLLQLLKEGKSQRDCARLFGTSESAISQRATKLLPPECLQNLTEKEQQFCLSVAAGKGRVQSVVEAYDVSSRESAKSISHNLMDKPEIKSAIQQLLEMKGLSREYRFQKLKGFVENVDPVIALPALKESMKIGQDYNPDLSDALEDSIIISSEEREILSKFAAFAAQEKIRQLHEEPPLESEKSTKTDRGDNGDENT